MSDETLNLAAARLDGNAVSGDDIELEFEFPWDMTGWHARLRVFSTSSMTGEPLVDQSDGDGLTIDADDVSTVMGSIAAEITEGNEYETLYYALRLTNASSKRRTWVSGELRLEAGMGADA